MSLDLEKLSLLLTSLSNFSAVIKDRLDGKLNAIDQAADSAKLEGLSLAEVQTLIGGDISAALATLEAEFAAFQARRDNPHEVTAEQVGLDAFTGFAPATLAEALEGAASDKLVTAQGAKGILDAFWAEQVGTAPETLDTINELAAALQNNPDIISVLQAVSADNADAIAALEARVDGLDAHTGKTYVEVGANVDANTITQGEEQVTLSAAIGTLKGEVEANLATVQGEIAAEISAREGADTALDTKFTGLTEALQGSKVDKGGDITDNTVAQTDGEETVQVTLGDLVAQLQAGIAAAGDATALEALQVAFNAFVAAKATGAEVIEGTDDTKYTTALAVKTAIDSAVAQLVGAAPEALDTINELAAALQNNPDVISALQALVQGNADALAALSIVVDGKLDVAAKATAAEVTEGTDEAKYITPAALKPTLDAHQLAIDANNNGLEDLVAQLTAAFDAAAADLDQSAVPEV